MSLMFPTIYGIALGSITDTESLQDAGDKRVGDTAGDVKIGASGLIMAILGGALLTPVQGMVSDAYGINMSYLVPLSCFLVVLAYALYTLKGANASA